MPEAETEADIGYGAEFGIEGSTQGEFDWVADVVSIAPPALKRDTEEAAHLQSPGRHKEYIPSMLESGDATIGLNHTPANSADLVAAFEAGKGTFQIKENNGTTLTFKAIVVEFAIGDLVNSKMTSTATFKPTQKPVRAAP